MYPVARATGTVGKVVEGAAGARQLDLDSPPVDRVAASLHEPRLLESVEVARKRRPLDAYSAGELELSAALLCLEPVQDQPDRDRAAVGGESLVESPADRLGRHRE